MLFRLREYDCTCAYKLVTLSKIMKVWHFVAGDGGLEVVTVEACDLSE